jgi:hypothetical protein
LVNQKIIDLKYLFLHVSILILIATLPLHFYISSELEKSSLQDKISLQGYAQKVANKIYKFSNSSEREFFSLVQISIKLGFTIKMKKKFSLF